VHQTRAISTHSQVFFIIAMDPVIMSVTEQDPASKEEALIDRDSDVFDTEITVSPVSVSRSNLLDNVGRQIPFLEAVQASIVPYVCRSRIPLPRIHKLVCRTILTGREGHFK
jgi:hypothetical protein